MKSGSGWPMSSEMGDVMMIRARARRARPIIVSPTFENVGHPLEQVTPTSSLVALEAAQ